MTEERVPALVIAYNRPDFLRQLLQTLTQSPVSAIYIAVDGVISTPGVNKSSYWEVWEICQNFTAEVPVHLLTQPTNLGTGRAVPAAISWFFDQEERGVILEDDCRPTSDFFPFAIELLDYYAESDDVFMISGNNHRLDRVTAPDEYSFSRHGQIWGWASWRRAWAHYDHSMAAWPSLRRSRWLEEVCGGYPDAVRYWRWIFDETIKDKVDAWDYRWTFAMWHESGLSVVPPKNLVENIGFDARSTHTTSAPDWYGKIPRGEVRFPLRHPAIRSVDSDGDRWTDVNIFNTELRGLARLKQSMLRTLARVGLDRFALRLASLLRSVRK